MGFALDTGEPGSEPLLHTLDAQRQKTTAVSNRPTRTQKHEVLADEVVAKAEVDKWYDELPQVTVDRCDS